MGRGTWLRITLNERASVWRDSPSGTGSKVSQKIPSIRRFQYSRQSVTLWCFRKKAAKYWRGPLEELSESYPRWNCQVIIYVPWFHYSGQSITVIIQKWPAQMEFSRNNLPKVSFEAKLRLSRELGLTWTVHGYWLANIWCRLVHCWNSDLPDILTIQRVKQKCGLLELGK